MKKMHSKLFWIRAFAGMTFFILFTQLYAQTSKEFFDLGKLKKGQKGYAETVFEGTEPEKFDFHDVDFNYWTFSLYCSTSSICSKDFFLFCPTKCANLL